MQNKIKQVYIPYWEWEDWKRGMWRKKVDNEIELIDLAIKFTGDHKKYGKAMNKVVNLWERTMINTLTNPSVNKRAFVGHCAVCMELNIPEYITRKAWKLLTQKQRDLADYEAQKAIDEWKTKYLNTLESGKIGVTQKAYQMKLHMT